MSTRVGSTVRDRPQKHQNSTQWNASKFKTDAKAKLATNLTVANCCKRCTEVIEWKVRYGKYKPLSQPAKCVKCQEKAVKSAYQVACGRCVERHGICAKCCEKADAVNQQPAAATAAEVAKLDAEFQRELKALPERKRRTFLRRRLEDGDGQGE